MLCYNVVCEGSCTLAFSSLGLIINQLVDRRQRASLNGLVMAVGSVSKTIGPFMGAWLYAWSISPAAQSIPFIDYRFIFVVLMLSAVCSAMVPVRLPDSEGGSSSAELTAYKPVITDDDDLDDETHDFDSNCAEVDNENDNDV